MPWHWGPSNWFYFKPIFHKNCKKTSFFSSIGMSIVQLSVGFSCVADWILEQAAGYAQSVALNTLQTVACQVKNVETRGQPFLAGILHSMWKLFDVCTKPCQALLKPPHHTFVTNLGKITRLSHFTCSCLHYSKQCQNKWYTFFTTSFVKSTPPIFLWIIIVKKTNYAPKSQGN